MQRRDGGIDSLTELWERRRYMHFPKMSNCVPVSTAYGCTARVSGGTLKFAWTYKLQVQNANAINYWKTIVAIQECTSSPLYLRYVVQPLRYYHLGFTPGAVFVCRSLCEGSYLPSCSWTDWLNYSIMRSCQRIELLIEERGKSLVQRREREREGPLDPHGGRRSKVTEGRRHRRREEGVRSNQSGDMTSVWFFLERR